MKIVAIIQARMGSTRLPGKILKKVQNRPLLSYQLERLKQSSYIDELVIATTVKKQDDEIVNFCEESKVQYYRGEENDVLSRYYKTAQNFGADIIVRITSDCPIIDVTVVDYIIRQFLENKNYDYASNTLDRTYPRGLDTEVFSMNALERAYKDAKLMSEREHVTPYIYNNPTNFKLMSVKNEIDYSKYRWTVDTEEDFELIKLLIERLFDTNPSFSLQDAVLIMEENPNWFEINKHVEQKKL